MKREIPAVILFLTGLAMIAERLFKATVVTDLAVGIRQWGIIIAGFALATAACNLVVIHAGNIQRKRNVFYSATLLISLFIMAGLGVFLGITAKPFRFLYLSLLQPLNLATFAMLAFYVASTGYRAFVARNFDATVLLVTGLIVMLHQTGLGEIIFDKFDLVGAWVNDIPNLAAQRGLIIGAAIGAITIGLRVLVGIDRAHFGGGE